MKKSCLWTAVAFCSIVAMVSADRVHAQQGPGSSVVVVDIARVFKEHNRLKQAMELLGNEVKEYDNFLRQQQGELKSMAERRQNEKPGTPEYKDLDTQITKKQSELQLEMQLKKKEFMEREAKLFYNTYTEVTKHIAEFADANKIRLVIRYDGAPIKRDDRNSVLQGVNNDVIFQRNLDITDIIIKIGNDGSLPPQTARGLHGNQVPPFGSPK